MGFVDFFSQNPFAKTKKISAYDDGFVLATLSNIWHSFQQIIQRISPILKKVLYHNKAQYPHLKINVAFDPLTLISAIKFLQLKNEFIASLSPISKSPWSFDSQITLPHNCIKNNSNKSIAMQLPLSQSKPAACANFKSSNKSHYFKKFSLNAS